MNKEELKNKFRDYVSNFDMSEKAIVRKYYHSLRVMDLSILIAKGNELKGDDLDVVTVSGLLHDYARFSQWEKYKTYSDIDSLDHGDLAVTLLFDDEIKNYYKRECNYKLIKDAIKYHNKLFVPDDLSNKNKLFCNIIRDADKLDIFYLFCINKDLIVEDNEDISLEVERDFYLRKCINYKMIKNKSDKILLDLALVFDLNFNYSFKYLKETKLIDKIYEGIVNKAKYKKYFDFINKYIEERIDIYVRYKI